MFARMRSAWQSLRHRSQFESELDDEMRFHVEARADDLVRSGLSREEAMHRARIEFGCVEAYQDRVRESRRIHWLEDFAQDLRFGARMLRKSPGFTVVAVLTLALGIGANTAMFSIVNAILLRPLPFKDSERVVVVWWGAPARDLPNGTKTLDVAADYEQGDLNLTGPGPAERIPAAEVSENFFRVFALSPARGRTLSAQDETPGQAPVVVLSHEFWQIHCHSDPDILTKTVYLNGKAFAGVLREGFDFPAKAQVWLPLPPRIEQEVFGGNAFMRFQIGHLRAGVTLAEARSELQVIQQREAGSTSSTDLVRVQTLRQYLVGDTRQAALMLFAAVGFVLLIACADVANLLLARVAGRAREMAVRRAVGASRPRLIRQFLSESLLLSFLGGAVGILFGWWAIVTARALLPARTAFATQVSLDGWVLAFTCALAVGVALVAGIVPALQATRSDLGEALKEGAKSSAEGFRLGSHRSVRSLLGISEVALALILAIGAVLFLRSLSRLLDVSPGFATDNLLVARLSLLGPKYEAPAARAAFLQEVLARTRALPGVRATAFVTAVPLDMSGILAGFNIEVAGPKGTAPTKGFGALYVVASPAYFRTMRIPFVAGRDFADQDTPSARPVAIISQSLAQSAWPDRNPVGGHFSTFSIEGSKQQIDVVGIVGDVRHLGLSEDATPTMYLPIAQDPPSDASLVVHTDRNPVEFAAAVREAVRDVDSDEPIASVNTMDQLLSQSVGRPRFRALLLGIFGALALMLALIGIYGVISYSVAQRTHEIGIRMALGAERHDILGIVARYALVLAAIGLAIGLTGAYLLSRLASSFLYGVQPTDPAAFIMGVAMLVAVVLTASYVPAQRAMRVDPMVALRHE